MKKSVFIIGAGGMVGATIAQSLAINEIVSDIVLIDVATDLVVGQAMDISHATAFTDGVRVRVGDYNEIQDDDIVIITCGIAQKPDQSRLELVHTNVKIMKDVVGKVTAHGSNVYIIVVSNPVDILTKVALEVSGLPKERVFGTGTTLDTARLRVMLAHLLNVSQREVMAFVLGEHGDSSFAAMSNASIGGIPLASYPGVKMESLATIEADIRAAAYKIIEAKNSTYYGIGHVATRIVKALLNDASTILPICMLAEGEYGLENVVIGLPCTINSRGVSIVDGYPLDDDEKSKLLHSMDVLKEAYATIG